MKRAARVVIPKPHWVPAGNLHVGQAVPLDWDATLRTNHHGARRPPHGRRAAVPNTSAARARIRSLAWTPSRLEAPISQLSTTPSPMTD